MCLNGTLILVQAGKKRDGESQIVGVGMNMMTEKEEEKLVKHTICLDPYITDLVDYEYIEDCYPEYIENYKEENMVEGDLTEDQQEDLIIKEFGECSDLYQFHFDDEMKFIESTLKEYGIDTDTQTRAYGYDEDIKIINWEHIESLIDKLFGLKYLSKISIECESYGNVTMHSGGNYYHLQPAYEACIHSDELMTRLGLDPRNHLSSHDDTFCIMKNGKSYFISYDDGGLMLEIFENSKPVYCYYMGDNGVIEVECAGPDEQEKFIRAKLEENNVADKIMEINWWESGPKKEITKKLFGVLKGIDEIKYRLNDYGDNDHRLSKARYMLYEKMFDVAKEG